MSIIELDNKNFNDFISKGDVIVDFGAEWCGPCKIMAPELKKASEKLKNIKFGKVNVDSNYELAERFQVMSIPTTIFFKNKEQVDRANGAISAVEIEKIANKNFK